MSKHSTHTLPNAQLKLVDAVIRSLLAHQVEFAVISPGYRNAPLSLALWQCEAIRTEVVVDERTAAFVALGAARATGRPVAVCCTSGSALGHYVPAFIEASQTGAPLLALTADRPFELSRVGAPQAVPQRGALAPYVVYEDEISGADALDLDVPAEADPVQTRLAVALAALQRGPVHLNIPLRKPLDAPPARSWSEETRRVYPSEPTLSSAARARILQAAARAERPVIVDGPSFDPWSPQPSPAAAALAEATEWPLISDALAASRVSTAAAPHVDLLLRSERVRRALRPDFVLWFGRVPTSKWTVKWLAEAPATAIAINPNGDWPDPTHSLDAVMQGRAEDVAQIAQELPRASAAWRHAWRTASGALRPVVTAATEVMDWDGAVVRHALESWQGSWASIGSSLPVRDADSLTGAVHCRVFGNRGANGIDGSVATAWGHTWAHDRPGLLVIGDVTFQHDIGSLYQLPLDRPLTIVVVDNSGGRIFEQLPLRSQPGFEDIFVTPPRASAVEVARAAGIEARELEDLESLRTALAQSVSSLRPLLLRVAVDPSHSRARRSGLVEAAIAAAEGALS